jgi:transposase InsO family protein
MREDRIEMSQKERDRLKVLTEAKDELITQKQAAEQLQLSERQIRRLLRSLRQIGDRAVLHGLRGRSSNRKTSVEVEQRAIAELRDNGQCHDFGPSYATEHVRKTLEIQVSKDTVRKWMITAGLWQSRKRKVEDVHPWRPRRSCRGELVQWDTCVHDWLEGRGDRIYLIAMIDDASSHVFARFASHDTTEENMRVLWAYLERFGRPLEFYTDKAAMFEVTPKQAAGKDAQHMPATQITRALAELGIGRISAHSPQAKGRIERFFATAQDRLVKGLRLAGASSLDAANQYLEEEFLPEFNLRFAHQPANLTDAHRPLEATLHHLAASLSHVEMRTVTNDYTIQFRGERYQISRASIAVGMKGQPVRVEARLDGAIAVRYNASYLDIGRCVSKSDTDNLQVNQFSKPVRKDHNSGGRSKWMQNLHLQDHKPIWQLSR